MKKLLTILAFAASSAAAIAQSVECGGFSPSVIRPNETSKYVIVLKDINGSIDGASIPMPKELQIFSQGRAQSFTMGSGGNSSSIELTYLVRPLSEGEFTVPEWKVSYEGKEYTIAAATLKVDPNAPAQPADDDMFGAFGGMPFGFGNVFGGGSGGMSNQSARRQMQSYEDSLRSSAKLQVFLPREKIYIGEAVPCRLVFSCDKSLLDRGFKLSQLMPQIRNADAFDCPDFKGDPVLDTSDPNEIRLTYNTVITPLKVGTYDLDFSARGSFTREIGLEEMMNMSLADRMMSMGLGRRIPFEIEMPAKKVDVSPLPEEGKPADFCGAIGNFVVEGVTVDPDALVVGEPCTITARIIGTGNFGRINAPALEKLPDWKTYKPKSSFADESNGMGNIGIKTFEYTAVPTKADLASAPKFSFTFFDPNSAKYVSASSPDLPVSVAPTRRSQRVEERAANENLKGDEPTFKNIVADQAKASGSPITSSPYFWIIQLIIIFALAAFVLKRSKTLKLQSDPAYAKRISYRKNAKAFSNKAAAAAKAGNASDFLSHARSALQFELAANSEYEAHALLLREAEDIMRKAGFSDEDMKTAALFFDGKDAIAFGGLDPSTLNLANLQSKLAKLSTEIRARI